MELTNRRFAIFLTSGLTLAVLVGLLVWKVSDSGVTLNSQETEFAGQPVAAADATAQQRTADEPTSSETSSSDTTDGSASAGMDASTGAGNDNVAGPVKDPLAPPNANLNGNRGKSAEPSYYRPTNAAPAPAPAQPQQKQPQQPQQQQQQSVRTSASEPSRTPDGADSSSQGEAPDTTTPSGSTTVVPNEPSEPKRPSEPAEPGVQEGAHPPAADAELQSGNDRIEIDPSDAKAAAEALDRKSVV